MNWRSETHGHPSMHVCSVAAQHFTSADGSCNARVQGSDSGTASASSSVVLPSSSSVCSLPHPARPVSGVEHAYPLGFSDITHQILATYWLQLLVTHGTAQVLAACRQAREYHGTLSINYCSD